MKNSKRLVAVSLLVGSALALAVIAIARLQVFAVLDWIGPVYYLPFQGAVLLSGDTGEPSAWLYHAIIFLQFFLAALVVGWLIGRFRSPGPAA